MKNIISALNIRVTTAENVISELEGEMQKTSRQQQNLGKDLKVTKQFIREWIYSRKAT